MTSDIIIEILSSVFINFLVSLAPLERWTVFVKFFSRTIDKRLKVPGFCDAYYQNYNLNKH